MFIQPMYDKIKNIPPVFLTLWKLTGIYITWISIHYIAAHLYSVYCTPYTIIGFIISPFIVSTPHCTGLRWCISHGASSITTMWIVLGTWFVSKFGGYTID